MGENKSLKFTVSAFCIALNIVLTMVVKLIGIPFVFMDTVGTIFAAVLLGPVYGGIVGILTNVITAIVKNPVELPFGIVNLVIGVSVGLIAKKFKFNLVVAILTGILLSILAPLVGTPIAVYMFGGLAGSSLDILVGWLNKSGQSIFASTFIVRVASNLVDKILSCIMVCLVVRELPKSILEKVGYKNEKR